MKDFRDLQVWHKAHALTLGVYRTTGSFPVQEKYGIVSQVRRAAVSIGTNISEGCGRGGDTELRRFLQIAMGSASEVEYLLLLSKDLQYLAPDDFSDLTGAVAEVKRMLASLIRKLVVEA
jgi:four helix bundle protein